MKSKPLYFCLLVSCFLVVFFGYQSLQQRIRLARFDSLYPVAEHRRVHNPLSPSERRASIAQKRTFAQIWKMRHQQNISSRLIPFLKNPREELREQAVRALGRVESKPALSHLVAIKNRMVATRKRSNVSRDEWEKIKPVPDITLDLAIARIKSSDQTGRKKLDALAQSVGLQWNDVPSITHRAWYVSDGTRPPPKFPATYSEKTLIREIVDVLYQMRAKGENVHLWIGQLSLAPAEKIWLSTAAMPRAKAIKTLLAYISTLKIVRSQDDVLTNSIYLSLGDEALVQMRRRLEYLTSYPNPTLRRNGTVQLIRALSYAGDARSMVILKKLATGRDLYLSNESKRAIESIKGKEFYIYAPI